MMNRFVFVACLLAAPVLAQQTPQVKTEDGTIQMTLDDDGIPMVDFVKWAQELTGLVLTYEAETLAAAEAVKFTGTLRFEKNDFRKDFEQFFRTMLHIKGFALQTDDATGVGTIVKLSRQPAGARFVPAAELAEHKTDAATTLTPFALTHITPEVAIDRISKAMKSDSGLTMQKLGVSLVVQGTGAEVYCVSCMLHLIDVAAADKSHIVALEHAVAADLVARIETLIGARRPTLAIAANAAANAVLVTGPAALVEQAIEVITFLDRNAKK
ncbi:MAG: hypothetical protein KDC98_02120 [Planctomycetes bacterium]|nr:hypothetical protein [Planctomycetota bacterium]